MGRILHLISHLEEGGAQTLLANIVSLSKRHAIDVASLISSPPDKLFPFFQKCDIPVHFLSNSADFYHPGILPALRKLLRRQRYDVVQCWLFEAIVQGVLASRIEKTPCIAFPHTMHAAFKITSHRLWERFLARKTISSADLTIFPSSSTAMDFLHAGWVDPGRVRVVRNGVDCDYFQPQDVGDALVTVGRLSPEKGLDFLEKVIDLLRSQIPGVRCIVAGGGNGLLSQVLEHVGHVVDVRNVYKQAAVYISTAWIEGLSIALLESQAMGIPAVVRRIGPNSEVIEHGVNGFLADSEEEYVAACKALLEDPSLRLAMGAKARMVALERFPIERQVQEMESVHDELL